MPEAVLMSAFLFMSGLVLGYFLRALRPRRQRHRRLHLPQTTGVARMADFDGTAGLG
jgi:hypothetical protein